MVPFSPLDLTPQLWLDAADTSTITSSSGNVSQWNDKSGNAYHVTQAVGTSQPKTGTITRNGLNVLDFDGTNHYLVRETDTALGRNVSGLTVYWVASFDSGGSGLVVAFATNVAVNATRVASGFNTSTQFNNSGRTLDADASATANSSTLSTGTWYANCAVFDYANTDLNLYVDRTANGSNTSFQTATTTSNTDSLRLTVGSGVGFAQRVNGQIAEILVYHSAHSSADRETVFDYLDGKWGT